MVKFHAQNELREQKYPSVEWPFSFPPQFPRRSSLNEPSRTKNSLIEAYLANIKDINTKSDVNKQAAKYH